MVDVWDAVATVPGWSRDEACVEPLPGGLTNANFAVTVRGERFVLRINGPNSGPLGINRRDECRATAAAAEAGLAPDVVYFSDDGRVLVTRFLPGRAPSAEEMRTPAMMRDVAQVLRRVHAIPIPVGSSFCPFRKAEHWAREAGARNAAFPEDFAAVAEAVGRVEMGRPPRRRPNSFCHNDPVRGNFIIDPCGPLRLIDWEYAGAGDPVFDLAVISMNNGFDETKDRQMLAAYFGGDVSDPEVANLRALKVGFDFHIGVWCVLQSAVSPLDVPFHAGVRHHFDRLRLNLNRLT